MSDSQTDESFRYVTVMHQLKETETGDPGDRLIYHGERLDDVYNFDEEHKEFVPVARPIAVIDAGTEITDDEMTDWCNSHAGKHVLSRYFDDITVEDPTLPDMEEYVEETDLTKHGEER